MISRKDMLNIIRTEAYEGNSEDLRNYRGTSSDRLGEPIPGDGVENIGYQDKRKDLEPIDFKLRVERGKDGKLDWTED